MNELNELDARLSRVLPLESEVARARERFVPALASLVSALRSEEERAELAFGYRANADWLHVLVLLAAKDVRPRTKPCSDCDCGGLVRVRRAGDKGAQYCLRDVQGHLNKFDRSQLRFEQATRGLQVRLHFVRQQEAHPLQPAAILRALAGTTDELVIA